MRREDFTRAERGPGKGGAVFARIPRGHAFVASDLCVSVVCVGKGLPAVVQDVARDFTGYERESRGCNVGELSSLG